MHKRIEVNKEKERILSLSLLAPLPHSLSPHTHTHTRSECSLLCGAACLPANKLLARRRINMMTANDQVAGRRAKKREKTGELQADRPKLLGARINLNSSSSPPQRRLVARHSSLKPEREREGRAALPLREIGTQRRGHKARRRLIESLIIMITPFCGRSRRPAGRRLNSSARDESGNSRADCARRTTGALSRRRRRPDTTGRQELFAGRLRKVAPRAILTRQET